MLVETPHDVIRDAEIERAVLFAGKKIDVVSHRDRKRVMDSGLARKALAPGMTTAYPDLAARDVGGIPVDKFSI